MFLTLLQILNQRIFIDILQILILDQTMKNQQGINVQLSQSTFANSSEFLVLEQKISDSQLSIKTSVKSSCVNGNKTLFCCCTANCKSNAFLCGNQNCGCKKQHLKCFNYFQNETFVQHIKRKEKKQNDLRASFQNSFNEIIDKLSACRDQTLAYLKNIFFQTDEQYAFYIINLEQFGKMTGQSLQVLMKKFNDQKVQQKQGQIQKTLIRQIGQLAKEISKIGQLFCKSILNQNPSMRDKKEFQNQLQTYQFKQKFNSQILSKYEEIQTLNTFMPKNRFTDLKLLYRASQNQFSAKKFFQKCSNITNTLTLIKTQHSKIIGGYTPLPWRKYESKTQQKDPSGQTFIFSLTNKDKLKILNKQFATYYWSQSHSVQFGQMGKGDIAICDKSNQNINSFVNFQRNYENEKYKKNKESYQLFTGSVDSNFKAIQWEVFQVIF